MPRFFPPLFTTLLGASERQLVDRIQFLKAEAEIRRNRLPRRIKVAAAERARLDYLIQEHVDYFNHCRPHWARGHLPPCRNGPPPKSTAGRVLCEERLGGLLKQYYREAA